MPSFIAVAQLLSQPMNFSAYPRLNKYDLGIVVSYEYYTLDVKRNITSLERY